MAKINLEDLEALASSLAVLSNGWGIDVSIAEDSDKASAFDAGYRDGFATGLAALIHAADVHAEGRELNGGAHMHTYECLELLDLFCYLHESEED